NIIYIVALNSTSESLSKVDFEQVASMATQRLKDMGLNTEVRFFDPSVNGSFDPTNLDATDSYTLIGKVSEINDFIRNDKGEIKDGFKEAEFASKGWKGGTSNPEESALGVYGNNRILGEN